MAHPEIHFGRYDPLASSSIIEPNYKDLHAIGALFQFNSKQSPWPKYIEIIEDEGTSQSSNAASNPPAAPHNPPPSHNDSRPVSPSPPPRHTPLWAVGDVSQSECTKLSCSKSNIHKAFSKSVQSSEGSTTLPPGSSPCTTVFGDDNERIPDRQGQPRTPASTRYTPSHRSIGTNEDGNGRIGEPTSPPPWSPYDQKRSNDEDNKKK